MAAVFDGATSDLVVIDSAVAIDYPVLMTCFYKATNATHRGTLISLSDNAAGGSLDALVLELRGDAAGDWINAVSTAAGSSSAAVTTVDTVSTAGWRFATALFESTASRRVLDRETGGGCAWREETTTRAAGNWTHLSIGSLYNSGATNFFNGSIAQAKIWFNFDPAGVIAEPANRSGPLREIRPELYLHQGLTRKENDYGDWGPTLTNNAVTFDYISQPR